MTTLTFLTLFLGLASGVQPVDLDLDGPAARVELLLDGAPCGARRVPPWHFRCDFGDELAPHELLAVAYDGDGREVARRRQAVNLEPLQAEARLTLERDDAGRAAGLLLTWESVEFDTPQRVEVSVDGEPVPIEGTPHRIPLHVADDDALHFASTLVVFPDGTSARSEVAFGGHFGDAVSSLNTAVPLRLDGHRRLARPTDAAGWLRADGEELRPLAVDRGGADLVAVVDAAARRELAEIGRLFGQEAGAGQRQAGLEPGDRLFVLQPVAVPTRSGASRYDLFRTSPGRPLSEGGLAWQLGHVFLPPLPRPQRLADAVAMAAMQAAAGGRPRAVLLVVGPHSRDFSEHTPAQVLRFLERLRVPLHVWWVEERSAGLAFDARRRVEAASQRDARDRRRREMADAWGGVERIDSFRDLVSSARRLRDEIGRQRILWVEGRHLPQHVAFARPVDGVRLLDAGLEVPPAPDGALPAERLADAGAPAAGHGGPVPAAGPGGAAEEHAARTAELPPGPTLLLSGGLETFRDSLNVGLVQVEAVVTDRRGRPVTDLAADEFVVYEDGARQPITHFSAPPPVAGAEQEATAVETAGPPAAATAASEPFHLVVYLDQAHMAPGETRPMLARLAAFLGDALPAGARVMVLRRDQGLDVRLPFTADRETIRSAVAAAADDVGGGTRREAERRQKTTWVLAGGLDAALIKAQVYAEQREVEVRLAVRHLEELVDSLAGLPGRKVILYVSSGLPALAGLDMFLAVDEKYGVEVGKIHALEHDTAPLFQALADRANAQRVTFYTLDAAGLRPPTTNDVEQLSWNPAVALGAEIADNRTRPLHQIAHATGGSAITRRNRIDGALTAMMEEITGAYSLAYPAPAEGAGERHDIEVEVTRPGLRVRHREGYLQRTPDQRLADAVVAALEVPPANPWGVELELGEATALDDGSFRLPVRVRVPFERLVLAPSGSLYVNGLELVVAVEDAAGDRSPVQSAEMPVEIPADRVAGARGFFTVAVPLRLGAGEQTVAVGVRDDITGESSVVRSTVTVAPPPLRTLVAQRPRRQPSQVPGVEELLMRSRNLMLIEDPPRTIHPFGEGIVEGVLSGGGE